MRDTCQRLRARKVTYCGNTIRAEAELNGKGQWIGGGAVVGRDFEGILPLTAPLATPAAALDATLAVGRHWVDEWQSRGTTRQDGPDPP
jgi:hypothetical protein